MSAQAVEMWDYKTVVLTHGFMGFHKGELDRPEVRSRSGRTRARGL